jgi:hypothetical protein
MQELISSMMKFTAAVTLFSLQQVQNAVNAATDTQSAVGKFTEALDRITDSVAAQINDESISKTYRSVTQVQSEIVDRTFDAVSVQAFDPREVLHTTSDLMKKTSDAMGDLVKRAAAATSAATEPKSAADALGGN